MDDPWGVSIILPLLERICPQICEVSNRLMVLELPWFWGSGSSVFWVVWFKMFKGLKFWRKAFKQGLPKVRNKLSRSGVFVELFVGS